jgi:hypothetical protein
MSVTAAYYRCRGCLQSWDVNDFIQEVRLYILVNSNSDTLDRIEKAEVLPQQDWFLVRDAIRRVGAKEKKRITSGLPVVIFSGTVPDKASRSDLADLEIEIRKVIEEYQGVNRTIVEEKVGGLSIRKIARRVGVPAAQVHRVVSHFKKRLVHILESSVERDVTR